MSNFPTLIQNASKNIEPESIDSLHLAVDECFNRKEIEQLILILRYYGIGRSAGPLWNERRERADGSTLYAFGGMSRKEKERFSAVFGDMGKPSKYASTSDRQVLDFLISHFFSSGKLVLLTENTRNNREGLRCILNEEIKPALSKCHNEKLSLLVLFKKGKTTIDQYNSAVISYLRQHMITSGYTELFF